MLHLSRVLCVRKWELGTRGTGRKELSPLSLLHLSLHHLPERAIDARLVSLPVLLEPRDHVRIQPQCHWLLYRTVITQDSIDNLARVAGGRHQRDGLRLLSPHAGPASRPILNRQTRLSTFFGISLHDRHLAHFVHTLLYFEMFLQEHFVVVPSFIQPSRQRQTPASHHPPA